MRYSSALPEIAAAPTVSQYRLIHILPELVMLSRASVFFVLLSILTGVTFTSADRLSFNSAQAQTEQPEAQAVPEPELAIEPEAQPDTNDALTDLEQMTPERLGQIIQMIDPAAAAQGNAWQFHLQERPMYLVYDPAADRMRLMTPVASIEALSEELMFRMLQANYDAVLDPRYAVAQGAVWSVFIHPLATLQKEQLASAVAQVYIAAETFGSTFTSGALVFGGGDSQEEHRRLLESLQKLLSPTT